MAPDMVQATKSLGTKITSMPDGAGVPWLSHWPLPWSVSPMTICSAGQREREFEARKIPGNIPLLLGIGSHRGPCRVGRVEESEKDDGE